MIAHLHPTRSHLNQLRNSLEREQSRAQNPMPIPGIWRELLGFATLRVELLSLNSGSPHKLIELFGGQLVA